MLPTPHTKQILGVFWLSYGTQKRVYLVEKSVYDTDLNLQVKYKPCYIHGVGRGVNELYFWDYQDKPRYELYIGWYGEELLKKLSYLKDQKRRWELAQKIRRLELCTITDYGNIGTVLEVQDNFINFDDLKLLVLAKLDKRIKEVQEEFDNF